MNRKSKIIAGVAVLGGLALLAFSSGSSAATPNPKPAPNPKPGPNPGPNKVPDMPVPAPPAGTVPDLVTVAVQGGFHTAPHENSDTIETLPVGTKLVFVNPTEVESATPLAPQGWVGVFLDGVFGWFSMAKLAGDADTILTEPVPADHPYFLR